VSVAPALSSPAPGTAAAASTETAWKRALREAVRDPDELIDLLDLPETFREPARRAAQLFPLAVPRALVARMRPGDPGDPLLRQVLPLDAEEEDAGGFTDDPVGDGAATIAPGLIQKYQGRVLLLAAGTCAINCRFCFRRHFPYGHLPKGVLSWRPALERIAADTSIREVILSGGDPLVQSDKVLGRLAEELASIWHVKRLRVHTRLPVAIPERIDAALLGWLRSTRLTPLLVVHVNHPAELGGGFPEAIARLVDSGVPVLSQTVLLRGVNDDAAILRELFERLTDLRVLPYYLHQLDPVRGAAHFQVSEARGLEIMADLRRRLPGYAVPRYVQEVPGAESKVVLA
jgi:EF-P beta-lysylation protein EpmB